MVLIVASLIVGMVVQLGWLLVADMRVMRAMILAPGTAPPWTIEVARFVTRLGDPSVRTGFALVVITVLGARSCWRSALVFVGTATAAIGSYTWLKHAFARPRPTLGPWLEEPSGLSFPSGHAAGSMVVLLLAALLWRDRKLVPPAIGLALCIGVTRPMMGVHWPTDVLGGWLFGAGAALIGAGVAQSLDLPRRELRAQRLSS